MAQFMRQLIFLKRWTGPLPALPAPGTATTLVPAITLRVKCFHIGISCIDCDCNAYYGRRCHGRSGHSHAPFVLGGRRGLTRLCSQMVMMFSGDMALLAFGMIGLGLLLSGAIYYFFLRAKVRSQMPTVRGFDNPLHGSVNLAG